MTTWPQESHLYQSPPPPFDIGLKLPFSTQYGQRVSSVGQRVGGNVIWEYLSQSVNKHPKSGYLLGSLEFGVNALFLDYRQFVELENKLIQYLGFLLSGNPAAQFSNLEIFFSCHRRQHIASVV